MILIEIQWIIVLSITDYLVGSASLDPTLGMQMRRRQQGGEGDVRIWSLTNSDHMVEVRWL